MTYWPASSSTTPRYAGPVSFFRLPTLADPALADIALLGLPQTVARRTARAPAMALARCGR